MVYRLWEVYSVIFCFLGSGIQQKDLIYLVVECLSDPKSFYSKLNLQRNYCALHYLGVNNLCTFLFLIRRDGGNVIM